MDSLESPAVAATEKYVNIEDIPNSNYIGTVASIVDIPITEDSTIRVGVTKEYVDLNYTEMDKPVELSQEDIKYSSGTDQELSVQSILENVDIAKQELEEEEKQRQLAEEQKRIEDEQKRLEELGRKASARAYSMTQTQGGLVDIANPDPNYKGVPIHITGVDREIAEGLVMSEAGGQGFIGAALVAQCLRDTYLLGNFGSIDEVRRSTGYAGSPNNTPNQDVIDAVAYVFDQGGYAVQHRIIYFYNPNMCKSSFHESQDFVIEYLSHRVFDRSY